MAAVEDTNLFYSNPPYRQARIPNCLVITPSTVKASKIKSKAPAVAPQIVSSRAKKVVDWFGNIFSYQ